MIDRSHFSQQPRLFGNWTVLAEKRSSAARRQDVPEGGEIDSGVTDVDVAPVNDSGKPKAFVDQDVFRVQVAVDK